MNELDYKVLVQFVKYADLIESLTKRAFHGRLDVFRNRPRTARITAPKAVCLFVTYKLSEVVEFISEELKSRHPEIPWQEVVDLRHTIITREEGFYDPKAAWNVLTVDIPKWNADCCKILGLHNPDYKQDTDPNLEAERFRMKHRSEPL